jgi:carbon monoxide dehydrogenase subunit G
MRIEHRMEVACSPEHLWLYLEEPEKQKLWMKGVLSNESAEKGPTRVGSRSIMKIKEGGKVASYNIEVLRYEPHKHMGIKMWGGSFGEMEAFVDYTLTDLKGRTRLAYLFTAKPKSFLMKLLAALFQWFSVMQLKSFFKTLKSLAEAPQQKELA